MAKTIRILKNAKLSSDRKYKGDIDQLNSKIRELEFDNKELIAKLREKDKVMQINSHFETKAIRYRKQISLASNITNSNECLNLGI